VELITEIKRLLYDEKMTIEGAKQRLKKNPPSNALPDEFIKELKTEIQEIIEILDCF
jgi:hypothetical protein